jgi:hypothetical protein
LTADNVAAITAAADASTITGARYNESMAKLINR